MKLIRAVLFLVVLSFAMPVVAQDDQQEGAEQMQVWMDYMTPGDVHQKMAKMAGEWKTVNKMWTDPNMEPNVTEGTAVCEMLLGGRYLKTSYTGNFMGMPFEGFSIEAYDKAMDQFYSVWVDNFGTGMMMMKGKYDPETKTLTYTGTSVDPMQKKEMNVKEVFKIIDDNNFISEMYVIQGDQEIKTMEIDHSRSM